MLLETMIVASALAGGPAGLHESGEFKHESCEDPMPRLPAATASMNPLPRWMLSEGLVDIVQVNLGPDGMNILGDAANEPTIVVDPTAPNRMAICWRQFDTVESNFRQLGYSWSVDGGRTWAPIDRITPGKFRSDPVLQSGPDGTFHVVSYDAAYVYSFYSQNGGRDWSEPALAFGGDKEWLAVHPGGDVLFQHWTSDANRSFSGGMIPPGGGPWDVWERPARINVPIWGNSAFGPDDAYYVVGQTGVGVDLVRFDDPLADVLTPTRRTTVWLDGTNTSFNGPNPGGILGMPQVAINPASGSYQGEVYVVAPIRTYDLGDPSELRFTRSIDRGETWLAEPITINDDGPNGFVYQWFGTISIAPNGRIDVVWLDMRDDPDPSDGVYISELFYSSSSDGGRTWTPNAQLSVGFDSRLGWPNQNKMGDYYHMVSDGVGADLAWCATFEGEQNVYYTRIGPRDCNRNGIADDDDFASGVLTDCNGNGVPDECEIAAGVDVPCYGCIADFAEPYGTLDLADIVAFIVAFGSGDPRADLAEPFGVLDLDDISAFIQAFVAGCG
ncbi:MAG: exo-alpha-sialidase [Phycisphaeraceae bacterium]|nr:MAG: exo-alpha-sialidase [Phycisphaeraceae bacterium]